MGHFIKFHSSIHSLLSPKCFWFPNQLKFNMAPDGVAVELVMKIVPYAPQAIPSREAQGSWGIRGVGQQWPENSRIIAIKGQDGYYKIERR